MLNDLEKASFYGWYHFKFVNTKTQEGQKSPCTHRNFFQVMVEEFRRGYLGTIQP